jgi:hypothetical protein
VTPPGAALVIADLDQVPFGAALGERVRLPFLEHDATYFGPPATDRQALDELARLRALGATHFVLLWPAFWFFDAYPRFQRHLRRQRCLVENERTIVFDLRSRDRVPDERPGAQRGGGSGC